MANEVEICNGALLLLGDKVIVSLDDANNRAVLCKSFYPLSRDFVLRDHPWRCALERAELGMIAETPLFGFDYQYQLPADCLRVVGMAEDDEGVTWSVEGRRLLSSESTCNILYVKKMVSPGDMDSMLTMAITIKLATFIASAITDKANLIESLEKFYTRIKFDAQAVNAQEGTPDALEMNVLTDVRL